jgi:hypothetical protein
LQKKSEERKQTDRKRKKKEILLSLSKKSVLISRKGARSEAEGRRKEEISIFPLSLSSYNEKRSEASSHIGGAQELVEFGNIDRRSNYANQVPNKGSDKY